MASNDTNLAFIVLLDEVIENKEKMIDNLIKTDSFSNTILSFNTKEEIYASSIGALVT
ncbi:MAG: hypothetical protein PUB03_02865 [bacterium]|nr:hypothetical protein [bacterium]